MGRKCTVYGCKSGYDYYRHKNKIKEKVTIYGFPKDIEDRERWAASLPNTSVNDISKFMGVCALHWPSDVPFCRRGRYQVPAVPPSIFENVTSPSPCDKLTDDGAQRTSLSPRVKEKLLGVPNDCKSEIDGWIATPTDKITSFTSFCEEAKHYLGGNKWTYELDDVSTGRECIRFILLPDLQFEEGRRLFTISVYSDMYVRLFSELTGDVPDASLSWIFANEDKPPILENWSQFVTLVSQCSTGVWVDGNEDNARVCLINDLHQALEDDGDCKEKNAKSVDDNFAKYNKTILGLTEELYKVIFQRNQMIKKMEDLKELANINVDVLNSESKAEVDKVSKLVETINNDSQIGSGLEDLLPVLVEQYWSLMVKDNPFKKKSASSRRKSSVPRRKPKINKKNTTTTGEMNGNSNCAMKDEDASDQSLVVNFLQGEQQEKTQDNKDLYKNNKSVSQRRSSRKRLNTKILCKYCGKKVHREYINKHMLVQHYNQLPQEKLLDCSVCGKHFCTLRSLNQHIQFTHRKGLPNDCTICGRHFRIPYLLKQHIDVEHKEKRPYKCSKCGKTFKWPENYKRHMVFVHSDEKQFRCSICGHPFKRKESLVKHEQAHLRPGGIKRWRTDASNKLFEFKRGEDKRYYCIVCNNSFPLWSSLKKHMARHSDNRDYKCNVCGNTFKASNTLWRHMKTIHSEGTTAFQCSLCPKSFKLKSRLKSHQLVHTKVGLFKCTLCDKTFKWPRSLQKHQVTHSEITPGNQDCLQQERPYLFNAPGPSIAEPRDNNPLLKIRGDCLQQERPYVFNAPGPMIAESRDINPLLKIRGDSIQQERPYVFNAPGPMIAESRDINPLPKIRGDGIQQERSYRFTPQGPIMVQPGDVNPLLKLRGDCLQQERSYGVTGPGPGPVILGNDVNSMLRGGMEEGLTPFDYMAGPSQSYASL